MIYYLKADSNLHNIVVRRCCCMLSYSSSTSIAPIDRSQQVRHRECRAVIGGSFLTTPQHLSPRVCVHTKEVFTRCSLCTFHSLKRWGELCFGGKSKSQPVHADGNDATALPTTSQEARAAAIMIMIPSGINYSSILARIMLKRSSKHVMFMSRNVHTIL